MNRFWTWLNQLASPPYFWRWSQPIMRVCLLLALILTCVGLYGGLVLAPADYLQKDSFRIIYIHVPCAQLSMMAFVFMALQGAIGIIWRIKLCEIFAMCAAPLGAIFTAITLLTGMLWGKPTWGTYWIWDARLTSELVMLFLYLGVIALYQSYSDVRQGARAAGILALIGLINVPIIHYSVQWWNTLHQGQTISLLGNSKMAPSMLWPLLTMIAAAHFYFVASILHRARTMMLSHERAKAWVQSSLGLSATTLSTRE
jgi:heme exporter protein C